MNRKTELFLDKYRQLEAAASAQYDLSNSESAVSFLERRPEYRAIKSELAYCREVRNLLTHNPKIHDRYAVQPSDEMIALLDRVIARIIDPQRAKHIWIPRRNITSRTMNDFMRPAMVEMNERMYTHIPIVEELIERTPYDAPKVTLDPTVTNFYDFTPYSFTVENYQHGEKIGKFPVAV